MRPDEVSALMDRIVKKYGQPIETSQPSLTHLFPTPQVLSTARFESIGVPKRRSRSIQALARAVHEGALRLDGAPSLDAAIDGLRTVADLSATTAQYIAMRVYREPDAFPSHSHWLRKSVSNDGVPVSVADLATRAEAWRPWRAYAAMHLWGMLSPDALEVQELWNRGSLPPPDHQVA
jgi:3-methyladenine DNA glycosylase/8-oxoguanine DNA glycosylase